jgi:hypothetical protein
VVVLQRRLEGVAGRRRSHCAARRAGEGVRLLSDAAGNGVVVRVVVDMPSSPPESPSLRSGSDVVVTRDVLVEVDSEPSELVLIITSNEVLVLTTRLWDVVVAVVLVSWFSLLLLADDEVCSSAPPVVEVEGGLLPPAVVEVVTAVVGPGAGPVEVPVLAAEEEVSSWPSVGSAWVEVEVSSAEDEVDVSSAGADV